MTLYITAKFLRDTGACHAAINIYRLNKFGYITPADMVQHCLDSQMYDLDMWGIAHYLGKMNNLGADDYWRWIRRETCTIGSKSTTKREMQQILTLGVTSLLRKYYANR